MKILDRLSDAEQRRCERRARQASGLAVDEVPSDPAQLRLAYHSGLRAARASGTLATFERSALAREHHRVVELAKSSSCSCQLPPVTLDAITTTTKRVLAVEGQRARDGSVLSKDRVFRWALKFAETNKPIPVLDSANRQVGELIRIDDHFTSAGKLELVGHFRGTHRDLARCATGLCLEEANGRLTAIRAN